VDTRVLVLRLENGMAIVLPDNELSNEEGIEEDLRACLWECADRTRVVNSAGVRSAIESRCRGAKGEVNGDELLYERHCILPKLCRARIARIEVILGVILLIDPTR
jgi:hypothetical protein